MTKYDDYDFHDGEALEKGQPEDNAFTHIGFMLCWLIRHDMASPRFFSAGVVREVNDGSMRPNDLRDVVDGKLMSSMLKCEGSAFLDAYYPAGYGADYEAEFADLPDYGVPDDPEHQMCIDRRIDAAWERWQHAGRPGPAEAAALWREPSAEELSTALAASTHYAAPGSAQVPTSAEASLAMGGNDQDPSEHHAHQDPGLEAVILQAVGRDTQIQSRDADVWNSSLLNRVLRILEVGRSDVVVATAIGTRAAGADVEIYHVPGIEAPRLLAEFEVYFRERSRRWRDGPAGSTPARWAIWKNANLPDRTMIWFAVDNYVVHVAGPDHSTVEGVALGIVRGLESLGQA
jgi:hypothetical protein